MECIAVSKSRRIATIQVDGSGRVRGDVDDIRSIERIDIQRGDTHKGDDILYGTIEGVPELPLASDTRGVEIHDVS